MTAIIFLYSAWYIACMPPFMLVFMLVFHCWTLHAYIFYCTSKGSISASNVHTPTSKWLISASNVHTPKRMVQESQKFFWCVRLCLSLATSRSMSHKSSVSGMGGPVRAIRLINQKQLLLVIVGINIILRFGNKYVKLAWEFTGKPWQEYWVIWHLKKFEMTQKARKLCT